MDRDGDYIRYLLAFGEDHPELRRLNGEPVSDQEIAAADEKLKVIKWDGTFKQGQKIGGAEDAIRYLSGRMGRG